MNQWVSECPERVAGCCKSQTLALREEEADARLISA